LRCRSRSVNYISKTNLRGNFCSRGVTCTAINWDLWGSTVVPLGLGNVRLPEVRIPPDTHLAYKLDEEHNGRHSALARSEGPTLDKVVSGTFGGDLKHREPNLRQDEEESRRIVDRIPQHIVVLDSAERVIFANRQALEYTGLSLHEVRAGDVRERVFHPEDVERLREEQGKGFAGAIPFQNEQRLLG